METMSKGHAHTKQYNTDNRKKDTKNKAETRKRNRRQQKWKAAGKPIVNVAQKYAIQKCT